jgi:flagellar biosynthesis protein FliR
MNNFFKQLMGTATLIWNHIYMIACGVLAVWVTLPPNVADSIPQKYKPYIAGLISILVWVKAHKNLGMDQQGNKLSPVE